MDQPISAVINDVTESSVTVSWDTPSLGGGANSIFGYSVTLFPEEGDEPIVERTTTNITGLISNKKYIISVAAMGSDGRSGADMETTVVTGMLILQ